MSSKEVIIQIEKANVEASKNPLKFMVSPSLGMKIQDLFYVAS